MFSSIYIFFSLKFLNQNIFHLYIHLCQEFSIDYDGKAFEKFHSPHDEIIFVFYFVHSRDEKEVQSFHSFCLKFLWGLRLVFELVIQGFQLIINKTYSSSSEFLLKQKKRI